MLGSTKAYEPCLGLYDVHQPCEDDLFSLFLMLFNFLLQDVGHAITEAYSRVLGGLAFSILSRIGDIFQEDDLKNPTTPIANLKFDFSSNVYLAGIAETPPGHIKRSLIDQMNTVDGRFSSFYIGKASEEHFLDGKAKRITVVPTSPLRSRTWCYGREVCATP